MARIFLAVALLIAATPRAASAVPFTVNFAVTWDTTTNPARMGSGAVIGLTVDNGLTSALNQTYAIGDVQRVFVDSTQFGGLYAQGYNATFFLTDAATPLFSVDGLGQATIDFANRPFTSSLLFAPFIDIGTFVMPAQLIFRWDDSALRFLEIGELVYIGDRPVGAVGGSASRAVIPNGQLVGYVPDAGSTLGLLLVGIVGLFAAHKRHAKGTTTHNGRGL